MSPRKNKITSRFRTISKGTIFTKINIIIYYHGSEQAVRSCESENNLTNVLVTGGGIIPEEDADKLSSIGVGKLFGPGTPVKESLDYIESWVQENRR